MIYLNNVEFKVTKFPNNESLIDFESFNNLKNENVLELKLKFESNEDILNLMFIKKYLDEKYPEKKIHLLIAYMPYSRMDREINKFSFTLKYIASFINDLTFDKVLVLEPHSYVTIDLLDNCTYELTSVELAKEVMKEINFNKDIDYILYPDAGAQKKYLNEFSGYKTLVGHKKRNLQTGYIESLDIVGDDILNNAKVIIVDDLCSKGYTFYMSAQRLKSKGAGEIYLSITHLENNVLNGELPLDDNIKGIFATDSIYNGKLFGKLTMKYI